MNIGLYINSFAGGGAERVVSRLTQILSKQHNVFLIISDTSEMAYSYNGQLIDLHEPPVLGIKRIFTNIRRIKKLQSVKKNNNIDVVISFLEGANFVNVIGKTKQCKSIISIRNYPKNLLNKRKAIKNIKYYLMKYILVNSDYIIACSKLISKEIQNNYGIISSQIGVLYNPYNIVNIIELSQKFVDPIYTRFVEEHEFTFVTTGRLNYQKGYWHLIKIIYLLKLKNINIGLLIIGKGNQLGNIKKLIEKLNLEKNILLCGYHENPFPIEGLADSYISTSLFEGFPNALVEAMCIGLPIFSADCPSGPREILSPKLNLDKDISYSDSVEYGFLLERLDQNENWNTDHDNIEQKWADFLYEKIKTNSFLDFKDLSINRAKTFSYDTCLNKLNLILKEIIE